MPAATAKIVKMKTRNLFRALSSMMRSISVGVLERWSAGVVEFIAPSLHSSTTPAPQRALDFGFGVDEKIRARDDAFALIEAALHFVKIAVFHAERDRARFEPAFAFADKHNVVRAGRQHG